jgi:hypothetical protein
VHEGCRRCTESIKMQNKEEMGVVVESDSCEKRDIDAGEQSSVAEQ